MKQEYVNRMPLREGHRGYHDLISMLTEFKESDERILKITCTKDDYKSPESMASSISASINRHFKGGMNVTRLGWDLYIRKTT